MPLRDRITSIDLLARVEAAAGSAARRGAMRLLRLADDVGAQRVGRHTAMSLRLPGPVDGDQQWLTLFVLSTAGTVYVNWLDRWAWIGISPSVAARYRRMLRKAFGGSIERVPSSYRSAVPVTKIVAGWVHFERAVREGAAAITSHVRRKTKLRSSDVPDIGGESAVEGQLTEMRGLRRMRSQKLRTEALKRSGGVCACCETDYGKILGGRGWRVLQVHHRQQLSTRDQPADTTVDDLAVVCANCHMLIHADRDTALEVSVVAALWRDVLHNKSRAAK